MTRNTDVGPFGSYDRNEYNLKTLTRNNWRASLVPAAAVIPAPRVYIKVVAVKKLVVGHKRGMLGSGPSGPGKGPTYPICLSEQYHWRSPVRGASWVT